MTMLAKREVRPDAYETLVVDRNAPAELITSSYWAVVGDLQKRRERGEFVDVALHELTTAYECISDPVRRASYDAIIGHTEQALSKRRLPRVRRSLRSRLFRRPSNATIPVDYYEVLGISSGAPAEIVAAAYRIMRDQYLRIPSTSRKRTQLLSLLEDAYEVIGDAEKRQKYDERTRRAKEKKVAVSVASASVSAPAPVAGAPPAPPVALVPKQRLKWPRVTARMLGRVIFALVRSPYRGLALLVRAARGARSAPSERGSDPVASPQAQHVPIIREPPPRPREPSVDVEEALLGRLASSVEGVQARPEAIDNVQTDR